MSYDIIKEINIILVLVKKEVNDMGNMVLEMQLREAQRMAEKKMLLNDNTRSSYIKRKRRRKEIEEMGIRYRQKIRTVMR